MSNKYKTIDDLMVEHPRYTAGGESTITIIDPLIERAFKELIKRSDVAP